MEDRTIVLGPTRDPEISSDHRPQHSWGILQEYLKLKDLNYSFGHLVLWCRLYSLTLTFFSRPQMDGLRSICEVSLMGDESISKSNQTVNIKLTWPNVWVWAPGEFHSHLQLRKGLEE